MPTNGPTWYDPDREPYGCDVDSEVFRREKWPTKGINRVILYKCPSYEKYTNEKR